MCVLNRQRLKCGRGKQFDFLNVCPSCVSTSSDNNSLCPCGYLQPVLGGSKTVSQLFSSPFLQIERSFDPGSGTQGGSSLWPVYSAGLT